MIDAVLSPHLNTWTCGTAKWNVLLAKQLGVPCLPLDEIDAWRACERPLISARLTEVSDLVKLPGWFDLFVHDLDKRHLRMVQRAQTVWAANRVLARELMKVRSDVRAAWCPSSLQGDPTRGAYRVLVFGMAHKLQREQLVLLKMQLEREQPDYTVELSTAVHEGTPFEDALAQTSALMREIFGNKLRVLGYLADDALAKELQDCDAVALYYDPAVRENNTTAWAVLAAGKPLLTNCDTDSPRLDPDRYNWPSLVELLRAA